jgi:hypothetical protein
MSGVAARFLQILAGRARPDEFVEIRYRLEDGSGMSQIFESPRRLEGLATRVVSLGTRTDVYVGCAPRVRRSGTADAVERSFLLWADCDGVGSVEALETFQPAPAIVIASGTSANCHAYWPLTEPIGCDALVRANRRLAYALDADPAATDAARILRPPGTRSHKRVPSVPVEVRRLRSNLRWGFADVVGHLPDPPVSSACEPTGADRHRSDDPLLDIEPVAYVERLLSIRVPRHRKVPCPFHADTHPSLHVYETPRRGWYCFGRCRRGGTIYDLAAPLYGYETCGEDFLRLRTELQRLFGLPET